MSAVAMIAGTDGAIFAADTAIYRADDGVVIGFMSKLHQVNDRCLFGAVGVRDFGPILADLLRGSAFDDLVDGAAIEAARAAHGRIVDMFPSIEPASLRATAIICGWSKVTGGFQAFKFHTAQKYQYEPWNLYPASTYLSTNPGEKALADFGVSASEGSNVDLAARMVCANRSQSGYSDDHDGAYGVGGELEMVLLTAQGMQRWVAHSWADPVGRPIDPEFGEPMPAMPIRVP